jgi:hypothetical protein
MFRLAALIALAAACGTTDDDRPRDAQYITEAILAPTCGSVECHSTFAQSNGVVLDTYDAMRNTMVNHPLISLSSDEYDPTDPNDAILITWLTQTDPFGRGIGRMPYDAPMPNADIDLLKAWITGPVTVTADTCVKGTTACPALDETCADDNTCVLYQEPAKGAECDPSMTAGMACNGIDLWTCKSDWNFGELVQTCPSDCQLGACT